VFGSAASRGAPGRSGSLDRPSISRWTRCALTNGEDAGHVVVDIRLATKRRNGDLLRLRDHDRDLAPDTRKRRSASGGEQANEGQGQNQSPESKAFEGQNFEGSSKEQTRQRGCAASGVIGLVAGPFSALAATELLSEAFQLASADGCATGLRTRLRHVYGCLSAS
jgi:hypothetical protein